MKNNPKKAASEAIKKRKSTSIMLELLKNWEKLKESRVNDDVTVTIMKTSAVGPTECLILNHIKQEKMIPVPLPPELKIPMRLRERFQTLKTIQEARI